MTYIVVNMFLCPNKAMKAPGGHGDKASNITDISIKWK
jgi:hypothetical protein